jgi:hypothetical protein
MDLQNTLTTITIAGLAISFIAGITSQIWKSSVEIEGQLTKRLTPAGWLSLGISLIALSGSVASELIRVSISNNERLQAKTEAAQKQALQDQETRWRNDMSVMLAATKSDIEKNLDDTIRGFHESQTRFNQTQAEILASKQSLLESSLRHTNEIIVASQPLTSLSLHWQFGSASAALWQAMTKSQDEIKQNGESSQGGVPAVPFEVMEYNAALLPLVSYVAQIVGGREAGEASNAGQAGDGVNDSSIVVLIPLDESQNAILSFGEIGTGASWYESGDGASISAGFATSSHRGARTGNSTPKVTAGLAPSRDFGMSNYAIDWDLDPATLANAIDRKNMAILPTAKLPGILKVAIFYDVRVLPFQQNNFSLPYANLWNHNDWARKYITLGQDLENMMFTIEVNGFPEKKYSYTLKRMYKLSLTDNADDEVDTGCTILEFEAT